MPRPRSITMGVAWVASETMKRVRALMDADPNYLPTKAQAEVALILARAQAVLQGRKPTDDEEDEEAPIETVKKAVTDLEKATEAEHIAKRAKA